MWALVNVCTIDLQFAFHTWTMEQEILRQVNNTEISGLFRWGVGQQAEAGCNILITLNYINRDIGLYHGKLSLFVSRRAWQCLFNIYSCSFIELKFVSHARTIINIPTRLRWILWRSSFWHSLEFTPSYQGAGHSRESPEKPLTQTFAFTHTAPVQNVRIKIIHSWVRAVSE